MFSIVSSRSCFLSWTLSWIWVVSSCFISLVASILVCAFSFSVFAARTRVEIRINESNMIDTFFILYLEIMFI